MRIITTGAASKEQLASSKGHHHKYRDHDHHGLTAQGYVVVLPPSPALPRGASQLQRRMASGAASSRGACQPARVPWAKEFRLLLDRHLPTTRRLAADGCWYTWEEFAIYYREDAPAMWRAAWQREVRMAIWTRVVSIRWRTFARRMACWSLRRCLRCIRWRSFACSMASWRAACRGAVLRQMVDKRIDGGPRLVSPEDWPEAAVVSGQESWDEYNREEPLHVLQERPSPGTSTLLGVLPDTIEYWGDYVSRTSWTRMEGWGDFLPSRT